MFNFHEEVDCFRLFVVFHEVGDDGVDEAHEVVEAFLRLDAFVVFLADFSGERAEVFVSPNDEVSQSSLETQLQTVIAALLTRNHCKY